MPADVKRFQQSGQAHFLTFGCYHRRPLLSTNESKEVFEQALERIRRNFQLVYGYVIMPDHAHLLLSGPKKHLLSDALKSLKQGVFRRLIGEMDHFWEERYDDFNVRNQDKLTEKLGYIHRTRSSRGCVKSRKIGNRAVADTIRVA